MIADGIVDDCVGIDFGPSNIALAIALEERAYHTAEKRKQAFLKIK